MPGAAGKSLNNPPCDPITVRFSALWPKSLKSLMFVGGENETIGYQPRRLSAACGRKQRQQGTKARGHGGLRRGHRRDNIQHRKAGINARAVWMDLRAFGRRCAATAVKTGKWCVRDAPYEATYRPGARPTPLPQLPGLRRTPLSSAGTATLPDPLDTRPRRGSHEQCAQSSQDRSGRTPSADSVC